MFKFKCTGNFYNDAIISRNYEDKTNPQIVISSVENPHTELASTSDYLFDPYPDENGNKELRRKNVIDFPEIKDANSCLTTNDGLVIFNYDGYCIVYDLVYDNNTIFNDIDVDIQNHIDLIKYCKYTSPRVHHLDIVDGKVKPDIKFIDSDGTYHFFVDCDLNTVTYLLDEYGYYTSANININTTFDTTFNHRSNLIVSTNRFEVNNTVVTPYNDYWYYIIPDNTDTVSISFNTDITGTVYICC